MQTLNQNPLPVAKLDAGPHSDVHVCPRFALEIDFPSSNAKIGQKMSSGWLFSRQNGGGGIGMMCGGSDGSLLDGSGDKKIDTYYLSYSKIICHYLYLKFAHPCGGSSASCFLFRWMISQQIFHGCQLPGLLKNKYDWTATRVTMKKWFYHERGGTLWVL